MEASEEKLYILDLLKLNKSEKMYSEESVINIIKQVSKMGQPVTAKTEQLLEILMDVCENLELQLSIRGCQTESAPLRSDADSYGGIELLSRARSIIKKFSESKVVTSSDTIIEQEKPSEQSAEERLNKISTALALLNSMVLCGENHSDQTTKVFYEACQAITYLFASQKHLPDCDNCSGAPYNEVGYPPEFVEWCIFHVNAWKMYNNSYYGVRDTGITFDTIPELFQFWKTEIKDKT